MPTNSKFQSIICPIDNLPLIRNDKQFTCAEGHNFDLSKHGYLNLLPVQHKRSKAPGDSHAMIMARSRFLDSGIYQQVVNQLIKTITALSLPKHGVILDAGCGEGYYTQKLVDFFPEKLLMGLDISKQAIKAACKKGAEIDWIVASNTNIPLQAESVDVIICVFGFHSFRGFSRVLKPEGKVILVDPEREHLLELRQQLYAQVKLRAAYSIDEAQQHDLLLVDQHRLKFTTRPISQNEIQDLLLMTPHLFRATQAGIAKTGTLTSSKLSVDMLFRVLQKKACC